MAEGKQEMLPDSTQGETPKEEKKLPKGTKRKKRSSSKSGAKKKRMLKKKKTGNKSQGKTGQGSGADSETDLSKELKPLGSYLHDREEIINQAFKAIKGDQLQALIPDILKNVPIDELKMLCLNQLEGLSRKRIKHIIEGTEMQSSSDSDESGTDTMVQATAQTSEVEAVTEAAVQTTGAEVESTTEVNEGAVSSVDSTVQPAHAGASEEGGQQKENEAEEDIDGVPVEVDVNLSEFLIRGVQDENQDRGGDGVNRKNSEDRSRKGYRRKSTCEESGGHHSDQVSSSHQRRCSRTPSPRRSHRRRYSSSHSRQSSRSRSPMRYSRSFSRSRSRSQSRSRLRRRSISFSRSWSRSRSRSSLSRRSSQSISPDRLPPQPVSSRSPSPVVISEPVEAIQMRYPTPPTPTGSLSSGEIRDILDLADEDEDDEEAAEEDEQEEDKEVEAQEDNNAQGLGEMMNKQGDSEPQTQGESSDPITEDVDNGRSDKSATAVESVIEMPSDAHSDSKGTGPMLDENNLSVNSNSVGIDENVISYDKCGDSNNDQNSDTSRETDDSSDDTDSEEDDPSDNDEDVDLDLLDLGIDISQLNDQSQEHEVCEGGSVHTHQEPKEQETDAGETELEVLELELRARAIRSLMKKCLKEDEKS